MISNTQLRAHRIAGLQPGPRLIVTGAVHGNETAGTQGIRRVLDEIDHGEIEIPRGVVTFVPVCNPLAYNHQRRMGERNLNRRLQPTATPQDNEDRIAGVLCKWLAEHEVLLDLHSFRSPGQPFVIITDIRKQAIVNRFSLPVDKSDPFPETVSCLALVKIPGQQEDIGDGMPAMNIHISKQVVLAENRQAFLKCIDLMVLKRAQQETVR